MKYIFIFIIVFFIVSSCGNDKLTVNEVKLAGDGLFYYQGKPFTGQVIDLHKNGKLKYEMQLKKGIKNGSIKTFNQAGTLFEEENYNNGIKHGEFVKYFPDGTLEHQKFYVNGVKDGQWKVVRDKFNATITTYKMGKMDGYYKFINPYGDEEGTYQNNLKIGIWKKYDFYKRLISEEEYKNGVLDGVFKTYNPETGLIDIDGQYKNGVYINKGKESYKSVKIGIQIWMAENLNSISFQNGDLINKEDYQYYRNQPENYADKYGIFYNWKAITDKRNICPEGWRIPTKSDWELLIRFLGEDAFSKLKSSYNWEKYYGKSGTNETGMSIEPINDNSSFFWSNTESDEGYAWGIGFGRGEYIGTASKTAFQTCRCVKK